MPTPMKTISWRRSPTSGAKSDSTMAFLGGGWVGGWVGRWVVWGGGLGGGWGSGRAGGYRRRTRRRPRVVTGKKRRRQRNDAARGEVLCITPPRCAGSCGHSSSATTATDGRHTKREAAGPAHPPKTHPKPEMKRRPPPACPTRRHSDGDNKTKREAQGNPTHLAARGPAATRRRRPRPTSPPRPLSQSAGLGEGVWGFKVRGLGLRGQGLAAGCLSPPLAPPRTRALAQENAHKTRGRTAHTAADSRARTHAQTPEKTHPKTPPAWLQ
jgi:hypothetical protein